MHGFCVRICTWRTPVLVGKAYQLLNVTVCVCVFVTVKKGVNVHLVKP